MNELIGCVFACLVSGFILGMLFTAFGYCYDFKFKKLKQKKNTKKFDLYYCPNCEIGWYKNR